MVRRVKQGDTWHPATDHLAGRKQNSRCSEFHFCLGTDEYGTFVDDPTADSTFSRKFSNVEWDQLLFATGDLQRWLVVKRDELLGKNYFGEYPQFYYLMFFFCF